MMEFDHPNILRLIGITLEKEEQPLVILPFMKYGDLLTVIRDETKVSIVRDKITLLPSQSFLIQTDIKV